MTTTSPRPAAPSAAARLRPADLAALASIGLRTRKLRAGLSALGIAIGVAAIVAVLGLASSSQAALLAEIAQLGTNLLTVTNGQNFSGGTAELPAAAPGMIGRLPGVLSVQDTGTVSNVNAYRSPLIPAIDTNALSVDAATLGLPAAAGASLAQGSYLNAATARLPVAVLGAAAAQLLGIDRIRPGMRIWAATRRRSTSAPSTPRPPPPGSTTCSARRPTPRIPAMSTSPSRRTRSPPRPTRPARSTTCSSGWARSHCWSARSG